MASLAICLQPSDKNDVALDRQGNKKEGDIRLWSKPSGSNGLQWAACECHWPLFLGVGGELEQAQIAKDGFFFSPYSNEFIENHDNH